MFIGLNLSQTGSIVSVLDTSAGPNINPADVSYYSWIVSIHKLDRWYVRGASDINVKLSGTIGFYLRIRGSYTRVSFRVISGLAVPTLQGTTHIERFTKSLHPAEGKRCSSPFPASIYSYDIRDALRIRDLYVRYLAANYRRLVTAGAVK